MIRICYFFKVTELTYTIIQQINFLSLCENFFPIINPVSKGQLLLNCTTEMKFSSIPTKFNMPKSSNEMSSLT